MESPQPFNIEVINCNRTKKTGGERKKYGPAVLNHYKKTKPTSGTEFAPKRFSNVNDNGTLTIRLIKSDEIRTVHKRLIRTFNNQTVL